MLVVSTVKARGDPHDVAGMSTYIVVLNLNML